MRTSRKTRKSRKSRKSRKTINLAPKVSLLRLLLLVLVLITTVGKSDAQFGDSPESLSEGLIDYIEEIEPLSNPSKLESALNVFNCVAAQDPLNCFSSTVGYSIAHIDGYQYKDILKKFNEEKFKEGTLANSIDKLMKIKKKENEGLSIKKIKRVGNKLYKKAAFIWALGNAIKSLANLVGQ